jgi:1,4-alpha-glucan branching enzyme
MFTRLTALALFIILLTSSGVTAQDSLNVTFRYYPGDNALRSFVPGSFNNWGNNSSGRIAVDHPSRLTPDTELGFSWQTVRLRVGGGAFTFSGRPGYAYKFHEQYDNSGSQWNWFTDPINPIAIGNNNDSFIEVVHPLIFQIEPANNSIQQGEAPWLRANVAALSGDGLNLQASQILLNGQAASSFEGYFEAARQLLLVPSLADLGKHLVTGQNTLKLVAVTQAGITREAEVSFTWLASPEPVKLPRPAGLEDGITVHSDKPGSVSFSLFAPGKEFVYLIGDHSDWEVRDEFLMNIDAPRPDSVHFWITLDGLDDGVYRFQYLVDGEIRVADLFSELVLDPDLDRFIPSSVYPNMPAYPVGQTSGMVTVFEMGRVPYQWQSVAYVRPPQEELIIYELLLRDFVQNSTFDVLRDTLDYLQRLGVNAIELMPVSNFDGNDSWGYNPNFHGALDKSYGSRESFKRFVDEAQGRGIAVILDVVYNHTQEKSPLVMLYGTNRANNRFLGPGHAYNVFQHLNHDDPYIRYWLDRMNRYWVETYRIDGYRFDLTKGFAPNVGGSNNSLLDGYNGPRIANLKRMADRLWEVDPSVYIILEHFAANSEELELANYRANEPEIKGMMLWNNQTHAYQEASMGYIQNSNFAGVYHRNRSGFTRPNLVSYMESHDEQWIMFKNRRFGNRTADYDTRIVETALQRQQMTGAFFFTVPGPKMLWQFGELGYGGGANECLKPGNGVGDCLPTDPGRTSRKPIRWEYYSDPNRFELYQVWSAIINLRRDYPTFHSMDTQVVMRVAQQIKQIQLNHSEMNATIIGNFDVRALTGTVNFASTGTWYNYFTGEPFEVTNSTMSMDLQPGEFHIFTSVSLPVPDIKRPTSVPDSDDALPTAVTLYQNYPNPFNPSTIIRFDVPESRQVLLEVYDILGRKVATLVDAQVSAGAHTVTFDASSLGSGTYFARLHVAGELRISKMLLLK